MLVRRCDMTGCPTEHPADPLDTGLPAGWTALTRYEAVPPAPPKALSSVFLLQQADQPPVAMQAAHFDGAAPTEEIRPVRLVFCPLHKIVVDPDDDLPKLNERLIAALRQIGRMRDSTMIPDIAAAALRAAGVDPDA